MKITKKIVSVALAVLMVFSAAYGAFAETDTCTHENCYWNIEREATADYNGLMAKWCPDCHKTLDTKVFSSHEHTPGYESTLIAPYCETVGQAGVFCAKCNALYETKEIPALGHSGGSTTTTVVGSNLEIVFLIDESGSMSSSDPGRIRADVAIELTDNLGSTDKAAVIAFDDGTRLLTDFTSDKDVIKEAINQVGDYGGTDMYLGLERSFELFEGEATTSRYIVLLTDGESYGYYDYATAAEEKDVVIYTVGLGSYVNDTELEEIATTTGGKYYFADAPEDLFEIYEEITETIVSSGGTWVTTLAPTCSSEGEKVCFCTRCSKPIASKTIPALEHSYSTSVYSNEQIHTGTCANCSNTISEPHDWSSWYFNEDNSFFTDGTKTRFCYGCYKEETVRAEHTSIIARFFYPCYKVILDFFNLMPINWISLVK